MGDMPDPTILLRACVVSYTASHAACSRTMVVSLFGRAGSLSLRVSVSVPTVGLMVTTRVS